MAAVGSMHDSVTKRDLAPVAKVHIWYRSPLSAHWSCWEDLATYAEVLAEWNVDPTRFLMVDNSIKSDILPILELGGQGVHVPYHVTWSHEVVNEHQGGFAELEAITDLIAWLTRRNAG
jgi:hypothetical protein